MSDNFNIVDSAGTAKTIGAKDLSTVYLTKHIVVDDAGDIALVTAANAALAENAAHFLQAASVTFALDTAASAASQAVPLQVESTAAPNLRVGLYKGANSLLDTAAHAGYVYVTNGTQTMPTMDAAARPGFQKITDGTNTMPTMDAVGRAGFVKVTDGTNTLPTGDALARAVYVAQSHVADSGGSFAKTNGLVGTPVAVKASGGTIDAVVCTNTHSATQFVQLFNVASGSVTGGVTAPDLIIQIPAGETRHVSFPKGLVFGTAISMIATTASTGGTGATASTVNVTVSYK